MLPVKMPSNDLIIDATSNGIGGKIKTVSGHYDGPSKTVECLSGGNNNDDCLAFALRDRQNFENYFDVQFILPQSHNAIGFQYLVMNPASGSFDIVVELPDKLGEHTITLERGSTKFFGLDLPSKVDSFWLKAPQDKTIYMNIDNLMWGDKVMT